MLEWRPPALTITPHSHAHTASPRPLARTHDTNTKRNRNRFPDWGSTASIISPQSPIYIYIFFFHTHALGSGAQRSPPWYRSDVTHGCCHLYLLYSDGKSFLLGICAMGTVSRLLCLLYNPTAASTPTYIEMGGHGLLLIWFL